MFPIPFNFPFRKKDGSIVSLSKAIEDGGSYTLPTASASTKGGVKIGSGLSMSGETLNNSNPTPYSLPTASDEIKGGVKIGSGLSIDENGVLSVSGCNSGFTLLKHINSSDSDKTYILPTNINTLMFCVVRTDSVAYHLESVISYTNFEQITDAGFHSYAFASPCWIRTGSSISSGNVVAFDVIYDKSTRTLTAQKFVQETSNVDYDLYIYGM